MEETSIGLVVNTAWNSSGWTQITGDPSGFETEWEGLKNESWNFAIAHPRNANGWMHAYFHASRERHPIRPVELVVFCSRHPEAGQFYIVGIYAQAEVTDDYQPFPQEFAEDEEARQRYPHEQPMWNVRAPRQWVVTFPLHHEPMYPELVASEHLRGVRIGQANYTYIGVAEALHLLDDCLRFYSYNAEIKGQLERIEEWVKSLA